MNLLIHRVITLAYLFIPLTSPGPSPARAFQEPAPLTLTTATKLQPVALLPVDNLPSSQASLPAVENTTPPATPLQTALKQPTSDLPPAMASGVVANCGDNSYANYIYNHESGCNLAAVNSGGCLGIGQACPGSKLLSVCPDLNYACQNSFFTSYANAAYGGWAAAYAAWVSKGWW